ncbi:MAG TPA: hypothetical protein VID27_20680 [Blastocatellia bacterium]|jgi:hypothetical protein
MFIPRGKAVHENLSTSYVVLEALIAELCEGGFSGIVEISLRDADAHIIIDHGKVVVAVERMADGSGPSSYSPTTIANLSALVKRERGTLSVYRHSAGVTDALAGRFLAEPLYLGLSTDFADLNKMISKLLRENDRQWFIEVDTTSGSLAMIHIRGNRCRIIEPDESDSENDTGDLDPASNRSLRRLLDECGASGGIFDVYFKHEGRAEAPISIQTVSGVEVVEEKGFAFDEHEEEPAEEIEEAVAEEEEVLEQPTVVEETVAADVEEEVAAVETVEAEEIPQVIALPERIEETREEPVEAEEEPTSSGALAMGLSANTIRLLSLNVKEEAAAPADTEVMEDLKRLMSEIARTIEGATKEVEPGDSFSIYLRAGQLKVAERYPFLDPFGAEFEYLAGEIAFVGRAGAEDFVAGLTEALRHAVAGVVQTSVQPTRLRIYIVEDLRQLLANNREDFERYGLDKTIEQIISV